MAGTLARRHAQAIFQIALPRNELEQWRADLRRLAQSLSDPEFFHFWDNPRVRLEAKLAVLRRWLEGLNPLAVNLGGLLISRGRLALVRDIVQEYERLVDAHYGIEHAEVMTAIPLDEPNQERLARELGQILGKKIMVQARVDPSLIGGLVARIGDRVIDGSVKGRLESLRRSLVAR